MIERSIKIRFEEKFVKHSSGCYIWTRAIDSCGYGRISYNGKNCYAHVISFQLYKGITDKKHVCHTCDNPSCVNPEHLFLGTRADNMADMIAKGRGNKSFGSSHFKTNLKEDDVLTIRRLENIISKKELAKRYNVNQEAIYKIQNRITWKHVI